MKRLLYLLYLNCFFWLIYTIPGISQIKNIGVPYIRNYEKTEYGAATQNWDIVQDDRGVMYFANNSGILEFDGKTWNVYPIINLSVPRCLLIDDNNRIWVGAFNEFGYLTINKSGDYEYHSIKNLVPEKDINFGEIWKIHQTREGMYFQAMDALFYYHDGIIKKIENYQNYHFSFYVNNRLFIQEKGIGLMELRGEKLYLIEDGELFKGETEVWEMIPLSEDSILIATQRDGLFLYDSYHVQKYDFPFNKYLSDKQIYKVKLLQNKYFVFGTIQEGLLITDLKGKLIQHIDKSKGLQNNTVLSLFEDKRGQIWLGLDNGIDYIELNSAFTFFNDAYGVEGTGYTAKLYEENLFLGTNQGLYKIKWSDLTQGQIVDKKFKLIEGSIGQVWTLTNIEGTLFCGHNRGSFQVNNGNFKKISDEKGGWTFVKPHKTKNILLNGTYSYLSIYKKNERNHWLFEKNLTELHESFRILEIDSLNNIWVSHGLKGVYKLKLSNNYENIEYYKIYDSNDGLPSDIGNYVCKLYNKVFVCAIRGTYQYNERTDKFEKSVFFNKIFGGHNKIRIPKLDSSGNIWFFKNNHPALLKKKDIGFQLIESPFVKYEDIYLIEFENLEVVDNKNVIVGTENGFIHFDPTLMDTSSTEFSTLIRKVKVTKPDDSVLYYGKLRLKKDLSPVEKIISIPYKMNAMKFNFVATFFGDDYKTLYRFKLNGFDSKWSEWQSGNEKEYTNLPAGEYTFEVESKNIYGQIGKKDSYSFKIEPPWYESYWAFSTYLVLFILMVYLFLKYMLYRFDLEKQKLKRLEAEKLKKKEEEFAKENLLKEQKIIKLKNDKLEAEVMQRKAEMDLKNKELASVAIQITHKNEILSKLKSKIETISLKVNNQAQYELRQLIKTIDEDLRLDRDWEQFTLHFEEVHTDFFKRLRLNYKELTPKDLKMCAYLRMNLSTKEIAPLMNISVRGVEISRYRLRKKLGLSSDANLIEFMLGV